MSSSSSFKPPSRLTATKLVSQLVGALSPVNHKGLHQGWTQTCKVFISQVIIPQVMFFEPVYIPRALNTRTCLRQGDLFYSAGLHRNRVLATANTGKIGRGFGKMQMNGLEGQKQARKKSLAVSLSRMATYLPIPGFKGRMCKLCVLTRWNLISASAAPHFGGSDKVE